MQDPDMILIVDDDALNRSILHNMLSKKYSISEAQNGKEALQIINQKENKIIMILLDIMMPVLDGFGVLQAMSEQDLLVKIPVILITGDMSVESTKRAYLFGAADIISKPFDPAVIFRRVENIVELYRHKNFLEHLVQEQMEKIKEQDKKLMEFDNFLIDTLSTVVEFRNLESGQHIIRIRKFTKVLLNYVAQYDKNAYLTHNEIQMISLASALHDIGKIAIPDAILLKPGKLTTEEFEIMKEHTIKGCEILESMPYMNDKHYLTYSYEICRSHHERWDGKGYPDGLKGNEIPLSAQVVSLADVYDALVSERVYKAAYDEDTVVKMILSGECGQFSPDIIECFMMAEPEMRRMIQIAKQMEIYAQNSDKSV